MEMKMPTDDERREVARNIRENYVRSGLGYEVASAYNIAMAIGMNPGILVGDIDLWNRLADLIEPSCDRDALLRIVNELQADINDCVDEHEIVGKLEYQIDRIHDALGVTDG